MTELPLSFAEIPARLCTPHIQSSIPFEIHKHINEKGLKRPHQQKPLRASLAKNGWPRMRVIIGSSYIVTPPNQQTHRRRHDRKHSPKQSVQKISPAENRATSSPIPTGHSSQSTILSTVGWDLSYRQNYYADLASRLAKEGKLADFAMVVESVVVSGGISASKFVCLLNHEMVSSGISRSLGQGRIQCVVEVLKTLDKLEVTPFKLFDGFAMELLKRECQRIVKCGNIEEFVDVVEIFAELRFPIKELGDPSRIVKLCVDNGDVNLAIRYASLFPHAHVLFCTVIHEFGRKRDLASALTAFQASKKTLSSPNMYICRTIIDVCGLCGNYMKSRHVYEDLLSQNIPLNIYVVNSLMNVNAHDLTFTLQVYKNMQKLGVRADMSSYNIFLKACCLAGRVDLAQEVYGEVKHLESKGVLKLDVFTYCTLIKVFADAKLWQMALKLKEDMLSAGVTPNMITWSSLINACANAGLVEQAIHLFEEMLISGCEPNTQCCNILLQACVEACQYDKAFRFFLSWKQSTVQENLSEDNMIMEQKNNRLVIGTPNSISSPHQSSFTKQFPFKPSTATYNILMKACGTDYHRAKALMEEMKEVGISPNHISWSILIDTCGGSGNVVNAIQILTNMRASGINPDVIAYTTAIKVCVKSKNPKLAFSLFAEMKRYQIQPNLVTYNTLLRARSRYGSLNEVQQCLSVYQDMRKAGYKPNDYFLKELIAEWCEGVIQGKNQNQEEVASCERKYSRNPQSLLLEKVAAHLQVDNAENLVIDLQGLTKVEGRIVVLAVLRMIKENHSQGLSVKDDMLIILGPNKIDANPAQHNSEIKDAVTRLLQDELGLEVILYGPVTELGRCEDMENPVDSDPKFEDTYGSKRIQMELKHSTRRPAYLQRLKVTKTSLLSWLQRRAAAIR